MRAGLMRVNYDPRYTQQPGSATATRKPYETLSNRITLAKEIYKRIGAEKKPLKESLDEAARRRVKQHEQNRLLPEAVCFDRPTNVTPIDIFDKAKIKNSELSATRHTYNGLASREELIERLASLDSKTAEPGRLKLQPIKSPPVSAGQSKWKYVEGSGAVKINNNESSATPERRDNVTFFLPEIDTTSQVIERVKKAYQQHGGLQMYKLSASKAPPRTASSVVTGSAVGEQQKAGPENNDQESEHLATMPDNPGQSNLRRSRSVDLMDSAKSSAVFPELVESRPPAKAVKRQNILKLDEITRDPALSPGKSAASSTNRHSSRVEHYAPSVGLSDISNALVVHRNKVLGSLANNFDKSLDNAFFLSLKKSTRRSYKASLIPSEDTGHGSSKPASTHARSKNSTSLYRSSSVDTIARARKGSTLASRVGRRPSVGNKENGRRSSSLGRYSARDNKASSSNTGALKSFDFSTAEREGALRASRRQVAPLTRDNTRLNRLSRQSERKSSRQQTAGWDRFSRTLSRMSSTLSDAPTAVDTSDSRGDGRGPDRSLSRAGSSLSVSRRSGATSRAVRQPLSEHDNVVYERHVKAQQELSKEALKLKRSLKIAFTPRPKNKLGGKKRSSLAGGFNLSTKPGPVYGLSLHYNRNGEVVLEKTFDVCSEYTSRAVTPALGAAMLTTLSRESIDIESKAEPSGGEKRVVFRLSTDEVRCWEEEEEETCDDRERVAGQAPNMSRMAKGVELLNNPYNSVGGNKVPGLKQWQKPKSNTSMYRLTYGDRMGRPLRASHSSECLSEKALRANGTSQTDIYYQEYIANRDIVSAMTRRPKSVSEAVAQHRTKGRKSAHSTRTTSEGLQSETAGLPSRPYTPKRQHESRLYSSTQHTRATSGQRLGGSGDMYGYYRSRTVPPADYHNGDFKGIKNSNTLELERRAKVEAERAAKNKKVFTIIGPYPSLRQALRIRGWVEKFLNAPPPGEIIQQKKKVPVTNPDDPDYDGTADLQVKPWEEEKGYYGMMSFVLRNVSPSFIFTVRSVAVDSRIVKNGQIVNHFGNSKNITTKVGLCQNLRHVYWYDKVDPDTFYPRCYKMDEEDERESFIGDFRRSACVAFVQHFAEKYRKTFESGQGALKSSSQVSEKSRECESENETPASASTDKVAREASAAPATLRLQSVDRTASDVYGEAPPLPPQYDTRRRDKRPVSMHSAPAQTVATATEVKMSVQSLPPQTPHKKLVKGAVVSGRSLEVAYEQCLKYISSKTHDDIDVALNKDSLSESQWDQFITWYYQFVHDGGELRDVTQRQYDACRDCVERISEFDCQHQHVNGVRNTWILKPGAKSRGRGIQVADKLAVCLQQADTDGGVAMVIQKYIERPLVIYNTKFDIRQWFLVTGWNPLTVWFYQDCYLRFCSHEYTLDDHNIVIHLSNNSVQKNHKNQVSRSNKLPEDNMWTSDEFQEYLRLQGQGSMWEERCVPGMKKAILCSLLCTQEYIECRKSAFELYGADFMLTPDFSPWLLEINSSPSMARNTRATTKLVEAVLEDTCKVVLDRRHDKSADTGRFELIYAQKYVHNPPPMDMSLSVSGTKVKKPDNKQRKADR